MKDSERSCHLSPAYLKAAAWLSRSSLSQQQSRSSFAYQKLVNVLGELAPSPPLTVSFESTHT